MGLEVVTVREMAPSEVAVRVDYFHGRSDDQLRALGVERSLLPPREPWIARCAADCARPVHERETYALVWQVDGSTVGFSTADHIDIGREAFMHLHILEPERRHRGLGTRFVRESARRYFDVLRLERLFCEPNALNVAPNRTLQRAGFRYLLSHETTPEPINFHQVTTRWVLDRPPASDPPA